MFVHKALSDALSTQRFKTSATELVKKAKDDALLAEQFQVSLSYRKHINVCDEFGQLFGVKCWTSTENTERTATSVVLYQKF